MSGSDSGEGDYDDRQEAGDEDDDDEGGLPSHESFNQHHSGGGGEDLHLSSSSAKPAKARKRGDGSKRKREGHPKPTKLPKRDPNAPKKPQTAFLMYMQTIREKLKMEGFKGTTDQSQEAGKRWKVMSDEEKTIYQQMADRDKARYQEEMKGYDATEWNAMKVKLQQEQQDEAARAVKKKKDPTQPKRALGAYFLFMNDKRESIKRQNPQAGLGELSKIISEMWKKLTPEEKKPYDDKAAADKARYAREMETWKLNNPEPAKETSAPTATPTKKGKATQAQSNGSGAVVKSEKKEKGGKGGSGSHGGGSGGNTQQQNQQQNQQPQQQNMLQNGMMGGMQMGGMMGMGMGMPGLHPSFQAQMAQIQQYPPQMQQFYMQQMQQWMMQQNLMMQQMMQQSQQAAQPAPQPALPVAAPASKGQTAAASTNDPYARYSMQQQGAAGGVPSAAPTSTYGSQGYGADAARSGSGQSAQPGQVSSMALYNQQLMGITPQQQQAQQPPQQQQQQQASQSQAQSQRGAQGGYYGGGPLPSFANAYGSYGQQASQASQQTSTVTQAHGKVGKSANTPQQATQPAQVDSLLPQNSSVPVSTSGSLPPAPPLPGSAQQDPYAAQAGFGQAQNQQYWNWSAQQGMQQPAATSQPQQLRSVQQSDALSSSGNWQQMVLQQQQQPRHGYSTSTLAPFQATSGGHDQYAHYSHGHGQSQRSDAGGFP